MRFRGGKVRLFTCGLAAAGILAFAAPALAVVKREGTWPASDPKVSLDVTRVSREEAIRKLADAAGWSVVVHAPAADPVDVHVKDQPADKVLDLLLLDADYIATREGTLVSIRRSKAGAAASDAPKGDAPKKHAHPGGDDVDEPDDNEPDDDDDDKPGAPHAPDAPPAPGSAMAAADAPPPPPAPPPPVKRGRDRDVTGESLKIGKNEVVNDVSVMGGSLDVYGQVTGDIDVAGGTVHIHDGARVLGDVSAVGGDIRVDDGGRVDGDVEVMGGRVRRGEKAIIGGDVRGGPGSHSAKRGDGEPGSGAAHDDGGDDAARAKLSAKRLAEGKAGQVGSAFARMAMLFVFGTVLLALLPERMDVLKGELVARPMRSFAMGVIGVLGAAATFTVLCVTIIGVPFALIGALAAGLALLASLCAVLETVGRALVRHKSQNPYVHLGIGCALFLALTSIPYLGPVVAVVVMLFATGILVSTRLAGYIQKRQAPPSPYRAASL